MCRAECLLGIDRPALVNRVGQRLNKNAIG
jgi:hypothetical protein